MEILTGFLIGLAMATCGFMIYFTIGKVTKSTNITDNDIAKTWNEHDVAECGFRFGAGCRIIADRLTILRSMGNKDTLVEDLDYKFMSMMYISCLRGYHDITKPIDEINQRVHIEEYIYTVVQCLNGADLRQLYAEPEYRNGRSPYIDAKRVGIATAQRIMMLAGGNSPILKPSIDYNDCYVAHCTHILEGIELCMKEMEIKKYT